MRKTPVIDLTRETPLDVVAAGIRFGVHRRTIENWFKQGLEHGKLGGKVFTTLEAINRFFKPCVAGATVPHATSVGLCDALDAVRELDAMGIK